MVGRTSHRSCDSERGGKGTEGRTGGCDPRLGPLCELPGSPGGCLAVLCCPQVVVQWDGVPHQETLGTRVVTLEHVFLSPGGLMSPEISTPTGPAHKYSLVPVSQVSGSQCSEDHKSGIPEDPDLRQPCAPRRAADHGGSENHDFRQPRAPGGLLATWSLRTEVALCTRVAAGHAESENPDFRQPCAPRGCWPRGV